MTAVPLHGPEHAADPQRSYELLRLQGPVGLAEIAPGVVVHLVTDYRAALDLLQDTDTWTKDTRSWLPQVPENSPIRPLVEWRPSLFFADGEEHAYLRKVITDSFGLLDPYDVRVLTFRHADRLLQDFAAAGTVDLVSQYAQQLPLMVFNALFGMGDEYGPQLVRALSAMMDTDPEKKAEGAQSFGAYLQTLYQTKAAQRGHDLTSWFIDHPNGLNQEEAINQILITLGAGNEPTANLIANTCVRMLSDDRYYGTLTTGSLPIQHAIDDALWNDSPLANYSFHFPKEDITFHGTRIPAGSPVMVSYAAANTCPHAGAPSDGYRSGTKAHLAFAAGPHTCPARDLALLIATAAIERLASYLPDIELAVSPDQLTYRDGAIHRTLTSLPARFTPLTPDANGATPWSRNSPSPKTDTGPPQRQATASR
ncbi:MULTISPECIES: cytochrome P450 family protein [Streptomyces]|uniref:Cytochrome P450 n=1 Tax=Streptomyces acidicola TaxID=2596892 RepID=A0A5N8WNE3_9ACTN|nr:MULTISPECIES: cytochrome P450 [Streptomyces]MBA2810067.1 cytochrome P450 [Streptomyces sp. KM273126]MPY48366.1 cytochrome P450 [Streptomyces acidicola]